MTRTNIFESGLAKSYLGQDIYVIGSGKSMDFIPPAFFDNKATIGVNRISLYHPCHFYVCKDLVVLPEVLAQPGITVASRYNLADEQFGENAVEGFDYFYFDHLVNDYEIHLDELDSDRFIVSQSTITSGIHLAYWLGAKNIIIAGHDCGAIDEEENFSAYPKTSDRTWYLDYLSKASAATGVLADELRRRGVGIMSINPFVNFRMEGHKYT